MRSLLSFFLVLDLITIMITWTLSRHSLVTRLFFLKTPWFNRNHEKENYPIPPSRRAVRKVPKVGMRAAIKSKIAASVMAVKSVLLRPTRSAMHPHKSAPVARPVYVTTPIAKIQTKIQLEGGRSWQRLNSDLCLPSVKLLIGFIIKIDMYYVT